MDGDGSHLPGAGARLAGLDQVTVEVEKLVAGGDGLARHEGIPIFVPRAAPGDRLRVRLVERRPDYGRGEIVEILKPGPGRREPPCPHFGTCGGCQLQHLEEETQLGAKAEAALEALRRVGGIEPPAGIEVVAGEPWAYRLRTQLHTEVREGVVGVGYFARRSHELVAVERCPVLAPALEAELARLPARLTGRPPRRIDLAAGDDGSVSCAPVREGLPRGDLAVGVGDLEYRFDARCFFQAHRSLLPALVDRVVGTGGGTTAYDLYAGVGLFALALARRYEAVIAVEGDRVAARYARGNARRNRLPGVRVVAQAVESWIDRLPERAERVIVDPPRAGLAPEVLAALRRRRPLRLTYVSCHTAALARDLRILGSAYRITGLCLLDLFPQTGHLEIVAQLEAPHGGEASSD